MTVPRDAAREALAEILHQRFCQCGTPWSLVADRFFSKASDWYVHADAVRAAFAGASPPALSGESDEIRHARCVRTLQFKDARTCVHQSIVDDPSCVDCAHELGRRRGHVEAGAYMTLSELTTRLRAGAPPTGEEGARG